MKKLKKILLINWLYFSKELIEVGDINFLTGKNGAGKSTVIDALQIVLLGETNSRNFNQAANEKSQRTLEGYLRADMDDNSPYSRRGKDFSTYIVCEFQDEMEGSSFVTGVTFDCRSDGSYRDTFFIYTGTLPENCFIEQGEAMETFCTSPFFEAELCTGRILRYPKRVSPQHACKVERPQRAGLTDDEEGCFVPANCGYPKIYYGEHLRYSG